jgi:peptide/nickel transport system permease protein
MFEKGKINSAVDTGIVVLFLVLVVIPWGLFIDNRVELTHVLAGWSMQHPLGTDNLGRDLLVRLAEAVRTAVLPLWLGVIAGTAGGIALAVLMILSRQLPLGPSIASFLRIAAVVIASIPVGIVAFAFSALAEKAGIVPVLTTLSGFFMIRTYLTVTDFYSRDQKLGYWQAHAALGGRLIARIWRYGIIGEWSRPLCDTLSFHLRAAVAIEAALSYLGFGLQEPQPSFGNMLASHFDRYLKGDVMIVMLIIAVLAVTAAFPSSFVMMIRRIGTRSCSKSRA